MIAPLPLAGGFVCSMSCNNENNIFGTSSGAEAYILRIALCLCQLWGNNNNEGS